MAVSEKIMVVEDDANSRLAMAELLRVWGYQPETASDGLEALQKLSATRPTVVISDLQMPGLGGVELIEALRRSDPHVSCIVVTGGGNAQKAALVLGLGVVDFLEKPIDLLRLRRDLQKCLKLAATSNPNPI
jgi:DNA-binding NtrC family response regulator